MRTRIIQTISILAIVAAGSIASTQTGGPYQITSSTIDGGGGTSSGGPYTMGGTIGQADSDWSSGGAYEVLGGFWAGGPLCTVAFDDFARFADFWFLADMTADLDDSHRLDFGDLQFLTDYWLLSCPQDWPLK